MTSQPTRKRQKKSVRWTFGSVITAVHGVDWSARYQQGPLTEQVELDGPTVERFLQEGRRYFEGAVRELDESLGNSRGEAAAAWWKKEKTTVVSSIR